MKPFDRIMLTFITIILVVLTILLNSCTLTVHPDGSRTYGIDGEQAARAIEIYSAK
jgi:hypothetical protein